MTYLVGHVGRRIVAVWLGAALLQPARVAAAPPQGVESRAVRIQLDDSALQQIPGYELADLTKTTDLSPDAQALIRAAPKDRAIPVIFVVVGVLSIPVIWDTVREMLRRDTYGGVIVDARQSPALIKNDLKIPADIFLFIGPDGHTERYASQNIPAELLMKIAKVP